MSLPTSRQILTSLITQLQLQLQLQLPPDPDTTPTAAAALQSLPRASKHLILALSHLLPHTFLPALELLDQRRVRRCRPSSLRSAKCAYFVTSSSSSLRVVRPAAWWCSCATFALAAFGGREEAEGAGEGVGEGEGVWGGRMLVGGAVPVCKHLVACVLVEECAGVFGGLVEEEVVALERWVEIVVGGR